MLIGIDFGTTNTGAALFDGHSISLLPLDPAAANPAVCRTAIYMSRTGNYYLGSTALNEYFDQNVGRPTRYRKIWIGEIAQVFAELPIFYRDVYVYEDEFSPGRLFLSIKTSLRNPEYYGTAFQGNWYTASDLVAVFLMGMKMEMEKHLGRPVREVVLGRPVHFSNDPQEDQVAQSRLLDGAFKAGFEKVYLEYEPVAAALSYERSLRDREVVLVFDFGGGTLDFTVMEAGGRGERRILATGGIPIAGDVFDQRLFRRAIPKHLGEGDYFASGDGRYPIPAHIFDALSSPHEIMALNTPQNLEMLRDIHQGALHKEKTHALLQVVSSNYALLMFALIEQAKRHLSARQEAHLILQTDSFSIEETISRASFERAIEIEYQEICRELLQTLDRSGLRPKDIDRVIRTGGSSQIPRFVRFLEEIFGTEKVRAIDIFSSVTSGLAIRGQQIAAGLASLPAYTPAAEQLSVERMSDSARNLEDEQEARQVDLKTVLKRLQVRQEYAQDGTNLPEQISVTLDENHVWAQPYQDSAERAAPRMPEKGIQNRIHTGYSESNKALVVRPVDLILLATDRFKFISVKASDLYIAQLTSREGVDYALPLEAGETITAATYWQPEQPERSLICMITSSGQGRCFQTWLLAEHLLKKPFLQLEQRYSGAPVALFPAGEQELILVGTNTGRAGRVAADEIVLQPYELIKTHRGEIVTAAAAFPPGELVLAAGRRGDILPIDPLAIPAGGPPASRGQTLRRNFLIVGFSHQSER